MAASLVPGQAKFAGALARETGLNPRVIGSWLLAEQSGSAAKYYEDKQPGGYNNWLNIAQTDSGPAGGANSSVWKNPETAAKATAEWLKGSGPIAKEYGAPAAGIRSILSTGGKNPEEQIGAIAKSGWASSGYNGGNTLRELFNQIGPGQIPVEARPPQSSEPTATNTTTIVGAKTTPPSVAFNAKAYKEASTAATIGKLFSPIERVGNPLFTTGALTTQEPNKAEFSTSIPGKVTATTEPSSSSGPSSANPATLSRTVKAAVTQLGTPYVWGGETEKQGFDCSGLAQWAYKAAGITIPRTAEEQYHASTITNKATPGSLIFFGSGPNNVTHVEIVAGNGKMIGADHTGTNVRFENLPKIGSKWGEDTVLGIGQPKG